MTSTDPWWYSGGADTPADDDGAREDEGARGARRFGLGDLAGLASGAQQLVDLARQALLVPHASHADPADHPDCLICRTMAAVGDVRETAAGERRSRVVEWIELDPPRR